MKTREGWRQHLSELVNASLDPMVYAVQWAHDPRCLRNGRAHRRVGALVDSSKMAACQLWRNASPRGWR